MDINFDFTDLHAFVAVMDTRSFHGAAQQVGLSQSAVTRRVQKLEQALDSALFERTTRHVKPTLAAKRFLNRAEAILDDMREASRAMRDESVAFAHQRGLVITVAIIPTLLPDLVPPAMKVFRLQHPTTRLRLLDFATNEVSEAVVQGDADFGICSHPALEPNTAFETLFEDEIVVAFPAGHPLASKEYVTYDDLQSQPLILPARRTGNRVLIDDAAARASISLRWTYEATRSTTALTLVTGGLGIALLPLSAVRRLNDQGIRWRHIQAPKIARPIGFLTRSGDHETPPVAALKAAIRSVF